MNFFQAPLIFLALTIGMAFGNMHTFTSTDGQRTFQGTFLGYNSETRVVTVRNEHGHTIHFNIDLVSQKDQDFVKTAVPQGSISMDVAFEPTTERKKNDRSGSTRTQVFEGGYTIRLLNYTPADLNNIEVDYLLVYRKDSVNARSETRTVHGKTKVNLAANGTQEVETTKVELVSFFKKGEVKSSGCARCPKATTQATASQRSRDSLAGCIARIKLNGEVVSVSATAPNILREYQEDLDSRY